MMTCSVWLSLSVFQLKWHSVECIPLPTVDLNCLSFVHLWSTFSSTTSQLNWKKKSLTAMYVDLRSWGAVRLSVCSGNSTCRDWSAGWTWMSRWCQSWGLSCQAWALRGLTPSSPPYRLNLCWPQGPLLSYRCLTLLTGYDVFALGIWVGLKQ